MKFDVQPGTQDAVKRLYMATLRPSEKLMADCKTEIAHGHRKQDLCFDFNP